MLHIEQIDAYHIPQHSYNPYKASDAHLLPSAVIGSSLGYIDYPLPYSYRDQSIKDGSRSSITFFIQGYSIQLQKLVSH